MGIPLVVGRTFQTNDRADSPPVAVVSESFARSLTDDPGSSLGQRIRLTSTGPIEWEVIGVVGDVQITPIDTDAPPTIYLSHLQAPENRLTMVLRTSLGASVMENQLRSLVNSMDSGVPVYAAAELDQQISDSRAVFSRRLPMVLIGVFAASALALTVIALYSTAAHDALTRRREFGIRSALGASPELIRRQMLSSATLLGIVGVTAGTIGAVLATRLLQPVLFGIARTDWRVYLAVAMGALLISALSSLRPAIRAGSVAPGIALRTE